MPVAIEPFVALGLYLLSYQVLYYAWWDLKLGEQHWWSGVLLLLGVAGTAFATQLLLNRCST
jgi:hypothetical protein